MSKLDCNTPRGQIYVGEQMNTVARLRHEWKYEAVLTNPQSSADIDVLFTRFDVIVGVGEVKSREMGMADLRRFGSYLVTLEKIEKLRRVGLALAVPAFLVVSLLKDGLIVYWKMTDESGNWLVEKENKITQTQATCNGGLVNRENSYVSLNNMKILAREVR